VIVRELCLAVAEGRSEREQAKALNSAGGSDTSGGEPAGERPRRSTRSQFKRDDAEQPAQA
jgi:hypothetical protein